MSLPKKEAHNVMTPNLTWIKIVTTIFDDEKIKIIETFPDRDAILVIWFKILCQAGKTGYNGELKITERIPLTVETLSTIFGRPMNTIRMALEIFIRFGMIELIEEKQLYTIPKWEKYQQTESAERKRELERKRQAVRRGKIKSLIGEGLQDVTRDSRVTHAHVTPDVTRDSRVSHENVTPDFSTLSRLRHAPEKEEEREEELEQNKNKNSASQKNGEDGHPNFCLEEHSGISPLDQEGDSDPESPSSSINPGVESENNQEIPLVLKSPSSNREDKQSPEINPSIVPLPDKVDRQLFLDFIDYRKNEIKKPMGSFAIKLFIQRLEELVQDGKDPNESIRESILNGWTGIFPPRDKKKDSGSGIQREPHRMKTFDEIRAERNRQSLEETLRRLDERESKSENTPQNPTITI